MTRPDTIRSAKDRDLASWIERSRGDGDLAVLDGAKPVSEALDRGLRAEALLLGDDLEDGAAASLRGRAAAAGIPVRRLESRLEGKLTDTRSPRGAILLVPRPAPVDVRTLRGPEALLLVLDGVQDPGNAGALARVAEAAGCDGIAFAPGSARPFSPRVVRASAGALLRLPVVGQLESLPAPPDPEGWNQLALDATAPRPVTAPLPSRPLAVVAGSEGRGLTGRFPAAEPRSIPMRGRGESLAVLSAVSVALWVWTGFAPPAPDRVSRW